VTVRGRRASGPLLCVALSGVLAACGGGFGSNPPAAPDTTVHRYVALGDGFTAAPYTGRVTDHDGCLRSAADYPVLVAQKLRIAEVHDVSCTGASTAALTHGFRPAGAHRAVPPQLDAVTRDTDLVTLGIGVEDADTLHAMFRMCLTSPCAPGTVEYTKVLAAVDQATQSVTAVLRAIEAKAPSAYVVVIGYPRLTPPPGKDCHEFPGQQTAGQDVDPVNYVVNDLNSKLQAAARQTGAAYVDLAGPSADHVLCSSSPWVHGMHGTPGTSVAYHPFAAEQRAVAEQLVAEIRTR
jgi:hypothetical protein